ncbi:hypothetical protein DPMN_187107 [Dreissena polymorpha]|uniref:Uncharacterized protein n=1 Tax=Dreissena polymorpha TaxID=45954 RepID=A0A9D4DNE6_DREPO|nr:hypothetical protein DPMN_187107 [Dreissena polymorpha]
MLCVKEEEEVDEEEEEDIILAELSWDRFNSNDSMQCLGALTHGAQSGPYQALTQVVLDAVVRSILWPTLFNVELDAVSCRAGTDLGVARIGILCQTMGQYGEILNGFDSRGDANLDQCGDIMAIAGIL